MEHLVGDVAEFYLAVAFFIGVVASYAFHRLTFISLGGLISVGYLAGALVNPLNVIATIVLSLVSYWLLFNLVLRFFVLSSRRAFELGVLMGMALGFLYEVLVSQFLLDRGFDWGTMTIVGFMVPGLIAHEFKRQGVMRTLVPLVAIVAGVGVLALGVTLASKALLGADALSMDALAGTEHLDFNRIALAVFVSVIVAALLSDYLGLLSGGYVTAAILVLTISGWVPALVLLGAVVITFTFITVACHYLPIFGKQRLTLGILVSGIVTMAAQIIVLQQTGQAVFTGFVVVALVLPALIANDVIRVGVWRTGLGMATTGAAVAGALALAG